MFSFFQKPPLLFTGLTEEILKRCFPDCHSVLHMQQAAEKWDIEDLSQLVSALKNRKQIVSLQKVDMEHEEFVLQKILPVLEKIMTDKQQKMEDSAWNPLVCAIL